LDILRIGEVNGYMGATLNLNLLNWYSAAWNICRF